MAEGTKTLVSWGSWPTQDTTPALDGCPSDEEILVFAQGQAPSGRLEQLHEHIDGCDDCQRLLVEAIHGLDCTPSGIPSQPSWNAVFAPQSLVGGRYRIRRLVGRGGMGEVYEAYDTVLQERVALKTVTSTLCDNEKAIQSLKDEVQLARQISHPNVCRIYDLGTHLADGLGQGTHFLTMEFVDGESLGARLRERGPLSLDVAQAMAQQLLHGLCAAHRAGILHRDLKSDNIMLRRERSGGLTPVILDFGLAKALNENGDIAATASHATGIIGTVSYMAPEQLEGEPLSTATDLYSFGVVWFEMLAGRLPFEGRTPVASLMARLSQAPAPPSAVNPRVPAWLDEIVLMCLSRHRKDRFASVEQVLHALETQESMRPRSRWRRTSRQRKSVLLVLVLVALTTGTTVAMKQTDTERHPSSSRRLPAAAPVPAGRSLPASLRIDGSEPRSAAVGVETAEGTAPDDSRDQPAASETPGDQPATSASSPLGDSPRHAAELDQPVTTARAGSPPLRLTALPSSSLPSSPRATLETSDAPSRMVRREPDWLPLWSDASSSEEPVAAE